MIVLDHNATTPVLPEVVDALLPWLREGFGNPSSDHALGRRAKEALEAARAEVAAAVGGRPEGVVFTGSGTEADNLAILGAARARPDRRHHVTSAIEHPAVDVPFRWLEADGHTVARIAPDTRGRVDPDAVLAALRPDTGLLSLMLANNETGVLQPVAAVGAAARARGVLVHTDAAQAVGRVPVELDALGVDLLTVVGHKLGAPKGVGALVVRPGTPLRPIQGGGGQERGLRPGTENVAYAVALGTACRLAVARRSDVGRRRDLLQSLLTESIPGLRVTGAGAERLPNTLHVCLPDVVGAEVLHRTTIAASTGSACHAGAHHPSAVLLAMGLSPEVALGAIRLSLGPATPDDEVREAARQLVAAWREVRGARALVHGVGGGETSA